MWIHFGFVFARDLQRHEPSSATQIALKEPTTDAALSSDAALSCYPHEEDERR